MACEHDEPIRLRDGATARPQHAGAAHGICDGDHTQRTRSGTHRPLRKREVGCKILVEHADGLEDLARDGEGLRAGELHRLRFRDFREMQRTEIEHTLLDAPAHRIFGRLHDRARDGDAVGASCCRKSANILCAERNATGDEHHHIGLGRGHGLVPEVRGA